LIFSALEAASIREMERIAYAYPIVLHGKLISFQDTLDAFMRGADLIQQELFSYRTLEERIPKDHPLRKRRAVIVLLLTTLDSELDALYARTGRASIPPERLLRASLIPVLFSIGSERQ
jgi:hypothetical protein